MTLIVNLLLYFNILKLNYFLYFLFVSYHFYSECTRGGFCNFMHLKPISRELRRELYGRSGRKRGGRRLVIMLFATAMGYINQNYFVLIVFNRWYVPTCT